MKNLSELREKYNALVKREIAKNKEILLESFIEYYGEKNRRVIESRFNQIVFAYYVDFDTIDYFIKTNENLQSEKYRPFLEFKDAHNDGSAEFNDKILPYNFMGITDERVLDNDVILNKIKSRIQGKNPFSSYIRDPWTKEITRLVCFELFSSSEQTVIHEINHSVTRDREFEFISEDWSRGGSVEKIGLMVDDDDESIQDGLLEELINDKTSIEIAKIFKRRGGDLSSFLMGGVYMSSYELNYYMIDEFFQHFEEFLKDARIGDNKNNIIKRVGKENYALFCQKINRYYAVKDTPYIVKNYLSDEYKDKVLEDLSSLVALMKEYSDTSEYYSKEELEQYYEYLKKQGHNVIILNEPDNSGKMRK
ncbi:MAG: hypothetical protein OSJ70_00795 [Bacilli bacterium]|nr:hypothetical protein [Bacilli bacterium]